MRRFLQLAPVLFGFGGCELLNHDHEQLRAEMATLRQHSPRAAICKSADGKVTCACEQKCVQTTRGCECQDPP